MYAPSKTRLGAVVAVCAASSCVLAALLGLAPSAGATDLGVNSGLAVAYGTYQSTHGVGSTITPEVDFYGPLTLDGTTVLASFLVKDVEQYYHGTGNVVSLTGAVYNGGPTFAGTCQVSWDYIDLARPNVTLQCQIGAAAPTTSVTLNLYLAPIPQPGLVYPGVYTDVNLPHVVAGV